MEDILRVLWIHPTTSKSEINLLGTVGFSYTTTKVHLLPYHHLLLTSYALTLPITVLPSASATISYVFKTKHM
jgi:hypothetical protein